MACYVIGPALLWVGVLPYRGRFVALTLFTAVMVHHARRTGLRAADLGFRREGLRSSLTLQGWLTLALIAMLVIARRAGWLPAPEQPVTALFALFYVLVSSPSQEFLYRGLLFAEFDRSTRLSERSKQGLVAALYSYLHCFYGDWLTIVVTLAIGLAWGALYRRTGNLWGAIVSHAVLGAMSIAYGLV